MRVECSQVGRWMNNFICIPPDQLPLHTCITPVCFALPAFSVGGRGAQGLFVVRIEGHKYISTTVTIYYFLYDRFSVKHWPNMVRIK